MAAREVAKWVGGLVAVGLLLLVISFFVADRQLAPPFEQAELGPITIPAGEPLADDAIVFASDETGNYELFVGATDGTTSRLTTDTAFESRRPRVSPDRRTILFYRSRADSDDAEVRPVSLWMIGAQGGDAIEVLPVASHGWSTQGGADWSPSGQELVMMGGRPQGTQIWITSADGRAVRSLVNTPGDNTDPSWSSDGSRILYVACAQAPCAANQREVFTVPVSGGDRIQITNDDFHDQQPGFSPDGRQIIMRTRIMEADEDGLGSIWDIRVVPTNRSQPPRRLVRDASISGSPRWLDNQSVIFDRIKTGETSAIMTARVSDGTLTAFIDGPGNEIDPAP